MSIKRLNSKQLGYPQFSEFAGAPGIGWTSFVLANEHADKSITIHGYGLPAGETACCGMWHSCINPSTVDKTLELLYAAVKQEPTAYHILEIGNTTFQFKDVEGSIWKPLVDKLKLEFESVELEPIFGTSFAKLLTLRASNAQIKAFWPDSRYW